MPAPSTPAVTAFLSALAAHCPQVPVAARAASALVLLGCARTLRRCKNGSPRFDRAVQQAFDEVQKIAPDPQRVELNFEEPGCPLAIGFIPGEAPLRVPA